MRMYRSLFRPGLFCCLLLALAGQKAHAQQKRKEYMIMGRYFGRAVVLRWAPATSQAWERANAAGYRLYRFDFNETEKNPLSNLTTLNAVPFKPFTLDQWKERFGPADTAAAIAAE
ncbi:MAG: hypothetical protein Q8927_12660, partial [Bacteroidota bacterium]|nr:hypothetical protein [Bacteroidota bacterium]